MHAYRWNVSKAADVSSGCFIASAWPLSDPLRTNKEQRKAVRVDSATIAALREADGGRARHWTKDRMPHGAWNNRHKDSLLLSIMEEIDSSRPIGTPTFHCRKRMPVEQEACETLPSPSRCLLSRIHACRRSQISNIDSGYHPYKHRPQMIPADASSSRDSCGSEPCQTVIKVITLS